ncbi:MAG: HAD-IB family hydrolase, partial [Candidatus Dormibacteraeota bacterium]|nr:HAD-IB family hydrolase [Candidatus Dormibacteraeota bacterium]
GLLVEPPGDGLGMAASTLAASPEVRSSMGVAARAAVMPRSWDAIFDALMSDYEQLVHRNGGGRPRRSSVRRSSALRTAAFFDVDRTLIHGSCLLALAGPLREAGILTRRQMVRAAVRQLMFSARGISGAPLKRAAHAIARAASDLDPMHVRAVGRSAITTHIVPRFYADSIRAVEEHRRNGHAIFLVSSAPEEIVCELAGHLQADGFAGTRVEVVDGRYTGRLLELCRGPAKAEAVRRLARDHQIDLGSSWAYADSGDDLDMLLAVGKVVCVNPDRRLQREAVRNGWRVRRSATPSRGSPALDVVCTG